MDLFFGFILDLIDSLPDELWGAAIALLTVGIASKNEKKRLKIQLDAEAKESDTQRKSDLRREVYLNAAESLNKLVADLAKLPTLDPSSEEATSPKEMLRFTGLSAQIQLIAEPETSKLAARVSTKYGTLFLKALQQLVPLRETVIEKQIAEDSRESYGDAINTTMAQIDALTTSVQQNPSALETLTKSMDALIQKSDELEQQILSLGNKRMSQQQDYLRWLIEKLKELNESTVALSVALRKEMNISGDEEEFRESAKLNQEELQQEFENLINTISSRLEQQSQEAENDTTASEQNQ